MLKLLLEPAHGGRADLKAIRGYSVIRELGRGGMGAVHLARHEATGVEVALKVMLPKVAASETARARFLREVALTRAMKHPHVVALHDAGFGYGTSAKTSWPTRKPPMPAARIRRGIRQLPRDMASDRTVSGVLRRP
ncbi:MULTISPECIES: protein kinase domain-containing protein [Streptomyces]|uniref:protein kinase domain-containing protein n=1 Tax=Streptomyces TaxID=1883 RepID=UPI0021AF875C|nr:protein kinase [Streptomyces sp. WAC05858]WTB09769.1 protein kinase [Streptomyces antimycoticus]